MSNEETTQKLALNDLAPKMRLEGTVTKIELFGAFVDVGAERDGLVHISQISPERVNRVTDVLKEGDQVTVWVQQVDPEQGRISLTMIEPPERTMADLEQGQVLTGTVTKLTPYGVFVNVGVGRDGLVHISEMSEDRVERPSDMVKVGQEIEVRVLNVNQRNRRIELSMKGIHDAENQMPEEEQGEEASMTAMEIAWQDALRREGVMLKPSSKQGHRHKSEVRRQQAAIIARTLKTQKE